MTLFQLLARIRGRVSIAVVLGDPGVLQGQPCALPAQARTSCRFRTAATRPRKPQRFLTIINRQFPLVEPLIDWKVR